MSTIIANYDKKYDILYIRDIDGGNSYGEEDDNGIVVYRNIETDDITGIAVYSIKDKLNKEKIGRNCKMKSFTAEEEKFFWDIIDSMSKPTGIDYLELIGDYPQLKGAVYELLR